MSTVIAKAATLEDMLRRQEEVGNEVNVELIDGEIVERPMTVRSPLHSMVLARLAYLLISWLDNQTAVVGNVGVGEVRCRLRRSPPLIVGIDLGVWIGKEFVEVPTTPPLYEGAPSLAVEVLSPSDRHEDMTSKLRTYIDCGVPEVWIVDPDFGTVTVHKPHEEPSFFRRTDAIQGGPQLPGLAFPVAKLFRS